MDRFEWFGVGRVIFGRGEFRRAAEIAATTGRRALVIRNGSAPAEQLATSLKSQGVAAILRRQHGEPTVSDVDHATAEARENNCDLVIALGGGSAIDAAKAVAALITNGGSAVDYMEVVGKRQKIAKPSLPWIAIPTTAGTGAEATRNAVIGFPEKKFKASIRSELMLPRVALIDPELGVGVPPDVTARSGMDALCQLIESYMSINANPISDAVALEGIRRAARSLKRAYEDGTDLDAREDMALAALFSGMTLTSAGLGAVHGFAAPLGANFPVPHGTACAALLPHVIRANIAALRDAPAEQRLRSLSRYAQIGRRLASESDMCEADAVAYCHRFTADLARDLHIPPLSRFGLKPSDVPEMVQLARKASSMRYNPVGLSDETLSDVLCTAIGAAPQP